MASSSASTLHVVNAHPSGDALKENAVVNPESTAPPVPKDLLLFPVPVHLRYNPNDPPKFGILMNFGLSLAATFLISNMYYCQPLLIQMAESFGTSYEQVSRIPTLIQAGYAIGLFFICPLGDILRRRQILLILIAMTATLSIPFALTRSSLVFEIFSFLVGISNVSPQILVPLAADLSHPKQRAFAYSIVLVGMLSGVLVARVFAGLVAEYTTWRVVYYMAVGIQYVILILCYLIIPDYPAKNPKLSYASILYTTLKFAVTEPMMIQIEAMSFFTSACFSSYWVTLTFLLGGDPYNYSTLVIGLFGLLGLAGIAIGPFAGRMIDRIAPWYSVLISTIGLLVFQAVQTAGGGINISAVIIACIGLDALRQVQNVGIMTCLFGIEMAAVSRLNALFVLSFYLGQLMGTSLGTKVFVDLGWRASSALTMGWYGIQLVILLLRGPHCKRATWFGYEGGLGWKRKEAEEEGEGPPNGSTTHNFSPTQTVQALKLSEKVDSA